MRDKFERVDDLYERVDEEFEAVEVVDEEFERVDAEFDVYEDEEEYYPVVDDWIYYVELALDMLKQIKRVKAQIRLVKDAYPAWAQRKVLKKLNSELSSLRRRLKQLSYKIEASCKVRTCMNCKFRKICAHGKKSEPKKLRRYL